jgi:ribose-phosphate pyrophosphokinase
MITINIDPNFQPFGKSAAHDVSRPFPSGAEINVQLDVQELPREVRLTCRLRNSDDIMKLLMTTDACRRLGASDIHLFLPYLPYARQDRVCNDGEALSLKVFADLLNLQNYASVTMFDVHSDVSPMAVLNSRTINNHKFVQQVLQDKHDYVIVSPDAGASKKVSKVALAIGYTERPVQCSKYRVSGGTIESVDISVNDFGGKDVFIIDDICDGGATFTKLATELKKRNAGMVSLIVSHGIFSKGLTVLKEGGLDHVYTTDSFKDQEAVPEFLTEVKLCSILT